MRGTLAIALVHHPVIDRRGDKVTSAVTNLDIHDLARTGRTYGVSRFYVVTPSTEQRQLVDRIIGHWREGYGANYNPDRAEALNLVTSTASLEEALADCLRQNGRQARPILTGATRTDGVTFRQCRDLLDKQDLLLVLGTGWGLAPELFDRGWTVLDPVTGVGDYNHLPVRAAAAIILDRLLGRPEL